MSIIESLKKNIRLAAIILIMVGIVIQLVVELSKSNGYCCTVICNLFASIGMGMVTVGIFDCFIGLTGWKEFFESVLKTIFTDKDYLKTIDDRELLTIQTEIYKKRTGKVDIDKEGSFYCFFNDELFRYMSEPYREDTSSIITVVENAEGDLVATEVIEYTCRAGLNGIQTDIKYAHDVEIMEYYALIQISISVIPSEGDRKGIKRDLHNEDFSKEDKKQEICPVSLSEYIRMDKLRVRVETQAILNPDSFQTWTMAFPTKNFRLTINVPDKWRVDCVALVNKNPLNFSLVHEQPHCIAITLNSWLLPQNGFAFRLSKSNEPNSQDTENK